MSRVCAALLVVSLSTACSYFKELQSAESVTESSGATGDDSTASDDDDDDSDGTADETSEDQTCEILDDDRCLDQDTLQTCDPETGERTEFPCGDLCTGTMNFSCVIASADARHGCWCVVPGDQKLLTCIELEGCLFECSGSGDSACADSCFDRTNAATIRTFGALVSCAHHDCDETCREEPEGCSVCIANATAGVGDCVLERSVCDSDAPSDPWWPD